MSVSIFSVSSTLPSHWKYISEGGATIVFSYIGPPNAELDGTVLRLRKSGVQTPVLEKSQFGLMDGGGEEPDDASIVFQEQCMERLIPLVHLPRLRSVRVDEAWLTEFARAHDVDRPLERSAVGGIDTSKNKAVLANDLVGGVALAVEIKVRAQRSIMIWSVLTLRQPKWSFLPNKTHLSEINHPIKSSTCRFCMHSHMRSGEGESVSLGYCPLDLFSNNPVRMRKAVYSLYDNWLKSDGSVNNLKVFVHGKKIGTAERFLMLENAEETDDVVREAFADAMLPLLIDTPVLRILNKIQRTLDALDIEGLSLLWKRAQTVAEITPNGYTVPLPAVGVGAPNPTLADWASFIDNYLSRPPFNHTSPNPEDLRYYLLAYLLSATFKDCSVIIRMDLLDPSRPKTAVDPSKVTIIDLDPKNMNRLQKWEKLDQVIVEAYREVALEDRKTCVDDWVDSDEEA
ncbi:inositol-pentakisphosphate 2-kinase [Hymenopellis radicata]|nr:inositol-pentakisphosphate 2-kinase [Hymenopellis radicata]